MAEKYKSLYLTEKAKKLQAIDKIEALEQENKQHRDHIKHQDIKIKSLEYDLKPKYLRQEE